MESVSGPQGTVAPAPVTRSERIAPLDTLRGFTVLGILLITGWGFGLYGRLQRHQLYYVVAAIWVFELVASSLWLRRFRMGPLEWCWRSLTYWKRQPLWIGSAGT